MRSVGRPARIGGLQTRRDSCTDHAGYSQGSGTRQGRLKVNITVTVNGQAHTVDVEPRLLLVHLIRENLNLTGTHIGCDTTSCGACTVLLDGKPVKSCTMFAVQADGRSVQTIEGVAEGGTLHPLQEGFWEKHGLQCGFCTPG